MFTSEEWVNSPWARKAEGKQVRGIIVKDKFFWPGVAYALKTTNPLVSVLRFVDSEQMPAMRFIYGAMDNAKEQIAKILGDDEAAYKEIWNIIDKKWEFQLHRDLHAATYYLNPRCQYADDFSRHPEVMAGLYNCMVRLISDPTEREKADLQLDQFVEKQNFFGLEPAKLTFTKRSPVAWWTQFGVGTPELSKFATRVLSLTCSSSACERNWNTFNLVHTKRRNRLTTKRLHTLVYINYNKKLKDRHRRLKSLKEGEDPLILKDVPSDDEWIADHDIGAPSNACDVNDDDSNLNFSQSKGIESSKHTQSQPIRKRTFSRKGKEKVTTVLVDEKDDFVEIESSEEEDDGEIRYDDDSIDDASNSDDIADN